MSCLDDAVVLRAVSGELTAPELAALDAHLDGCGDCRELVGAAGLALGSGRGAAAVDELVPGTALGRYLVERRLGAGAMGVVYAARDPELDRALAIKLVRPERAAEQHRLVREAQALARLAHPNVVTIHDVGRHGDDVYVMMERVDGPTLATWAVARSIEARLAAVVAVGRGLAAVHAAGLIHRDVKPANVLVGADDRPRLGDFGLAAGGAAAIVDGGTEDTTLTATGAVVGTPAYMAPEVLRGEPATAASDQWSFAITAWEVLLGARPFVGADVAMLRKAIDAGLPSTRWRLGRERQLSLVLRRALAAAPADRYRDVGALVSALASRRAAPVPVLGAAALAAVAIGAVVVWRGGGAPARDDACAAAAAAIDPIWSAQHPARSTVAPALRDALDRYAARWRDARAAVCTAAQHERDALADVRAACLATRAAGLAAIVDGLARPGPWSAAVAALIDPDECATSPALALFAPVPPAQREAVTALAAQIAAARARSAATASDAVPTLRALVTDADALGHRPTQAAAQLALAEAHRRLGHYADADRAAEAAALAAAAGHDDLTAARAWLVRVGVAGDRRDLHTAAAWLPHAAAAVERAGQPALLAAQVDNSAGLLALDQGRLDDAAVALERALTTRTAIAGDDVEVARTLSALGHLARLRGDLTAARELHQRALAIDRAALGGSHLDVARDLHNLGGVLRLHGDLDTAATAYREALAIRTAALGPAHPEVGLIHNSLGILALDRGALVDATRELETARAIFAAHDHLDRAIAIANLGRVALAAGDPALALTQLDLAIALDRAQLPPQHSRLAQNLLVAVRAAAATGATARARALLEQAAVALPADATEDAAELDALRRQLAPRTVAAASPPTAPAIDAGVTDAALTDAALTDAALTDAALTDAAAARDAPPPRDAGLGRDAYVPRGVYGSSQGWN